MLRLRRKIAKKGGGGVLVKGDFCLPSVFYVQGQSSTTTTPSWSLPCSLRGVAKGVSIRSNPPLPLGPSIGPRDVQSCPILSNLHCPEPIHWLEGLVCFDSPYSCSLQGESPWFHAGSLNEKFCSMLARNKLDWLPWDHPTTRGLNVAGTYLISYM